MVRGDPGGVAGQELRLEGIRERGVGFLVASLLAAVHMFTCTLQCTRSCDWRREMRNLFLCSGSTDRGPTCVRIKGQREGNGTLKRTEKTKDSCSLSERTHLASPRCTFYMCVLHTVGASVQKVCDWRRDGEPFTPQRSLF